MVKGAGALEGYWQHVSVGRITTPTNLALVILLAYTLADTTWLFLHGGDIPHSVVGSVATSPEVAGAQERRSLSELAQWHLLGEAGSTPQTAPQPVEAPETQLNLKLKGLFAVDNPDSAMAIIAADGRDELSYRVGQNVSGAAIVHQILHDRVILKRGERFETLMLPKELLEEGVGASAPETSSSSSSGPVRSLPGLRDRIMQDPQQAMSMIQARPVKEGGELKGYRVSPGKERALFARAGLRPNDVVTQVNGVSLSDTAELGKVMQQFRNSPRVELTVERGGRPLTLSLDLK
ncbi:MAG: type II secretion system protein GspC [Pseudomonadota bacterium]